MKIQCKHCLPREGIEIPDFSPLEKQEIWEWKQKSSVYAVKQLMVDKQFSLLHAKYIVTHLNKSYGHCNRCEFDQLDGEYITCPICNALNFNWTYNNQFFL